MAPETVGQPAEEKGAHRPEHERQGDGVGHVRHFGGVKVAGDGADDEKQEKVIEGVEESS